MTYFNTEKYKFGGKFRWHLSDNFFTVTLWYRVNMCLFVDSKIGFSVWHFKFFLHVGNYFNKRPFAVRYRVKPRRWTRTATAANKVWRRRTRRTRRARRRPRRTRRPRGTTVTTSISRRNRRGCRRPAAVTPAVTRRPTDRPRRPCSTWSASTTRSFRRRTDDWPRPWPRRSLRRRGPRPRSRTFPAWPSRWTTTGGRWKCDPVAKFFFSAVSYLGQYVTIRVIGCDRFSARVVSNTITKARIAREIHFFFRKRLTFFRFERFYF